MWQVDIKVTELFSLEESHLLDGTAKRLVVCLNSVSVRFLSNQVSYPTAVVYFREQHSSHVKSIGFIFSSVVVVDFGPLDFDGKSQPCTHNSLHVHLVADNSCGDCKNVFINESHTSVTPRVLNKAMRVFKYIPRPCRTVFNEDDVRRAYRFLGHMKETEIRFFAPFAQKIFVHSEQEFVDVCVEYNGKTNLYVGVNERRADGAKDEDVTCWRIVPVDIDAVRATGPKDPATVEEVMESYAITQEILKAVNLLGRVKSLLTMSGNGFQIWFRIPDTPVDDWNSLNDRSQAFQHVLQENFSDSKRGVVDKVGNLSRIMKIPGTMSVKGEEDGQRQHRLSKIVKEEDGPLGVSLLKYILSLSPISRTTPYEDGEIPEGDYDYCKSREDFVSSPYFEEISRKEIIDWVEAGSGPKVDRSKIDAKLCLAAQRLGISDNALANLLLYRPNSKAYSRATQRGKYITGIISWAKWQWQAEKQKLIEAYRASKLYYISINYEKNFGFLSIFCLIIHLYRLNHGLS